MTPEVRDRQAKALAGNKLLPLLLDEFAQDLREQWENTKPAETETREAVYVKLRTLDDLRDYIYARISESAGDGAT